MSSPAPGGAAANRLETIAGSTGAAFLGVAETAGAMGVLFGRILSRLFAFPPRFDYPELKRNLHKMAVKSLPIVVVTALFTGAIIIIQAAPLVKRVGAEGLLGWAAGFSTLREVAPLLTALMISGRVGANNTAELGTMVVTEQLDALRVLAIDPIAFLIVPRFIGIVVTLFVMTLYADALALLGAAFTGQGLLQVAPRTFYNGLTGGQLYLSDVMDGLIKSVVFGLVIALASCHFGLATKGGAPGVGRAVNATVVASAAGVFVLDYLVSFLCSDERQVRSRMNAEEGHSPHEMGVSPPEPPGAVHDLGAAAIDLLIGARELYSVFVRTLYYVVRGKRDRGAVVLQMYLMGNKSLFFVSITMGFIGMILLYQAGLQAKRVLPDFSMLGATYLELLVRDLAASLGALMLATRVGAGIAAEIGSMVVTEQVDALRMCAADPIDFLVVPRFLASMVMTTVLIVWAGVVAFGAGAATANIAFDVPLRTFCNMQLIDAGDLTTGLAKCVAYGAAIPIVSGYCGLSTFGGSEGVGWATTRAVVNSSLAIIILNGIISTAGLMIFGAK